MIGGFEEPTYGTRLPRRPGRDHASAVQARREHGLPVLRPVPAPQRVREHRVRPPRKKVEKGEIDQRVKDTMKLVDLVGFEQPQAAADVGRAAAAGRAGPGAGEPPQGAPAGRAAGRARPEAPQADAARAQAHPAGGRHHVHLRDPRPGRGHDDVEPPRGDASRARSSRSARPRPSTSRPATEFVAGFLGASNLLDGEVAGTSERSDATIALAGRLVSPTKRTACRAGPKVRVGVRPEKIHIVPAEGDRRRAEPELGGGAAPDVHVHRRQLPVQGRGARWGTSSPSTSRTSGQPPAAAPRPAGAPGVAP